MLGEVYVSFISREVKSLQKVRSLSCKRMLYRGRARPERGELPTRPISGNHSEEPGT